MLPSIVSDCLSSVLLGFLHKVPHIVRKCTIIIVTSASLLEGTGTIDVAIKSARASPQLLLNMWQESGVGVRQAGAQNGV